MAPTPRQQRPDLLLTPTTGPDPVTESAPTPDGVPQPTPGSSSSITEHTDSLPVGATYIWLLTLTQFGVFMAFITPVAISLSIRVQELTPQHPEYLGYVTGAGALAALLCAPTVGMLSDRTRTRYGRRRPFMIAGTVVGVLALLVMVIAPNVPVLALGWILAQLGWGTTSTMLLTSMADRVPKAQRGKISGLYGFASMVAPTVGFVLAGGLARDNLLLFAVPGAVGVVTVLLFVLLIHEGDSGPVEAVEPLTVRRIARKYTFSPRRTPDFSWNWLGRFLFSLGVTFNTTYTAFFFASRMHITVQEVAGALAVASTGGVVVTVLGNIGAGFLSDRLRRRRVIVLVAALLFTCGAVIMALSSGLPLLFAGLLITSLGNGAFSAVDQALALDVLPDRETDAGRYTSVSGFATQIPQAFGPLVAPAILALGAGVEKNYTLLYLIAAVCTVLGGLAVLRVRSVR